MARRKYQTVGRGNEKLAEKQERVKFVCSVPTKEVCPHCGRKFSSERVMLNHTCEKKIRWQWKDEPYVRIGFMTFREFFLRNYKREKSYEDFVNSQYFSAFTKFGKYCVNINAIDIQGFINFLFQNNVQIKYWTDAEFYNRWIQELYKKESLEKAIERSVKTIEEWSNTYEMDMNLFFKEVSTPLAVSYIVSGKLSPILIFTVGMSLVERMSDEQLKIVKDYMNPDYWYRKLSLDKETVDLCKSVFREFGF